MKALFTICLLTATAGFVAAADDSNSDGAFKARLDGWKEVPAVVTTGSGELTVTVDETGKTMKATLTYADLLGDAKEAHLHLAQAGVNGPAVVQLCGGTLAACSGKQGSVEVTVKEADILAAADQGLAPGDFAALVTALRHGSVYVTVATAKFEKGEIRGQLGRGLKAGGDKGDDDPDVDDTDGGTSAPDQPGNGNGNGNGNGKGNGHN
jgi:hypothetical protein